MAMDPKEIKSKGWQIKFKKIEVNLSKLVI
jgi:hypothetical protein